MRILAYRGESIEKARELWSILNRFSGAHPDKLPDRILVLGPGAEDVDTAGYNLVIKGLPRLRNYLKGIGAL